MGAGPFTLDRAAPDFGAGSTGPGHARRSRDGSRCQDPDNGAEPDGVAATQAFGESELIHPKRRTEGSTPRACGIVADGVNSPTKRGWS